MVNISRHQWVSEAAYFKAKTRNFAPGKELDDWLAAEQDYQTMAIGLFRTACDEDGGMTISGLQHLAKSLGVEKSETMTDCTQLIQAIQHYTHHRPCFRLDADMICTEVDCQWRHECRRLIAEWCR
jgi:hypothetical protein